MKIHRKFSPVRTLFIALSLVAAQSAFGNLRVGLEQWSYTPAEVAAWALHGVGDVKDKGDHVVLREGEDSLGVVLLTPERFGDRAVLRYWVKPNQHEGVLLAMLAVSGRDGGDLVVPEDHRGAMAFWNGPDAQGVNFMAAFHTGYHQPEAFMRRNPGGVDLARTLDPATKERWYEVEFGREGSRVWLRIDGELLLESEETRNRDPGGGRVGFRLRGPGDGTFSAKIRDVRVSGMPLDDSEEEEGRFAQGLSERLHPMVVASAERRLPELVEPAWLSDSSRGPEWRFWSLPRLEQAYAQLLLGDHSEAANTTLLEVCETLLIHPSRYVGAPSGLQWLGPLLLRIWGHFGPEGSMEANKLTPETQSAMAEIFWQWARRCSHLEDTVRERLWTFWSSENKGHLRDVTAWGASAILASLPDYRDRAYDSGGRPGDHLEAWTDYLTEWMKERGRKGLIVEIASPTYTMVTVQCWYTMLDLAEDPEMRRTAEHLLHLWWAHMAHDHLDGVRGGGKARVPRGVLGDWDGHRDIASAMYWAYLGKGSPVRLRAREAYHLILTTSGYELPELIADLALDRLGRGTFTFVSRRPGQTPPDYPYIWPPPGGDWEALFFHLDPEDGGILRYSYVTPKFIVGSLMSPQVPYERWARVSDQNRWSGVVFHGDPRARVFPQSEMADPETIASPRYRRILPRSRGFSDHRALQHKGTMIARKLDSGVMFGELRVFVPEFMERVETGGVVFVRHGDAVVAARPASGGYDWESENWLRPHQSGVPVILDCFLLDEFDGSMDRLMSAVLSTPLEHGASDTVYTRVQDGAVLSFNHDGHGHDSINGEPVNYTPKYSYHSPFIRGLWPAKRVTLRKDGRELELEF